MVTKYRRQVIDVEISEFTKNSFERMSESYHITLVEWSFEKDNVHIMFKAHPKTELATFINASKSSSSRLIKRDFPRVKQLLKKVDGVIQNYNEHNINTYDKKFA